MYDWSAMELKEGKFYQCKKYESKFKSCLMDTKHGDEEYHQEISRYSGFAIGWDGT